MPRMVLCQIVKASSTTAEANNETANAKLHTLTQRALTVKVGNALVAGFGLAFHSGPTLKCF